MANVKSRVKAPKSASARKGHGNTRKSLTGAKDAEKRNVIEGSIVMRRPSTVKLLSREERVQYFLQHGHLLKDKIAVKPPLKKPIKVTTAKELNKTLRNSKTAKNNISIPPATRSGRYVAFNKELASPPISRTKSGRIKKKNKDSLKLIDNILKSELMIIENSIFSNSKESQSITNGVINNNDNAITDQNTTLLGGSNTDVINKHQNSKATVKKDNQNTTADINPKPKQVTLSNGIVLTLGTYECDYCKKVFDRKASILRHMYVHLGIKPYKCPHCNKKYRNSGNIQTHVRKVHKNLKGKPEPFICNICDKPFLLKENLDLHMISHIKRENSVKCIYCDKKFSHQLLLTQHEKEHLVTGKYQCTLCNLTFRCRNLLCMHVKSHLKIKDFICQYCGKEFLRQNSLRRHVEICHGGHRIQCPICHKNLKGHLTEHMRTHDNMRPHECPDCGQRFTQSTQLTVHRRSHTGARPYPCRICGRPFNHSNALTLHIRRHTGERPFQCAMCPMSFSQLPHMKAHMRKIHGKENPYKCGKCDQYFKLKAQLETHARTCTVGDIPKTFEELLSESVQGEEAVVESVMSLSRMRFLLALLLTMIATKEKLKQLGFNKRLIDDLLIDSLEAMGQTPCKDETLSPLKRLKTNIEMLLIRTVPKEQMEKCRKEKKSTEELLELLTSEKK